MPLRPVALVICVLAGALSTPSTARAEARVWAVKPGESLARIARRFDVDVDQLKRWNDLGDDTVVPGQELVIEEGREGDGHVVAAGETLSGIAVRYGVSVEDLLESNPGLTPDRIREGQRLVIGDDRRRISYRISGGDTLSGIARRYDVSIADLKRWNEGLAPNRIRAGQVLKILTERPASLSESVGTPNAGKLLKPRRLPRHHGYVIRDRDRAWGTDETVRHLVGGIEAVRRRDPKAPRLRIHDLSLKRGGQMTDHKSHQSGRDADLSYFQKRCEGDVCPFRRIAPSELDVERQWALLEHWLERDLLEAVFIDYRLQPALYREARRRGASKAELQRWFQYPNGSGHPLGIIRHFPKHGDHMHVRFACHASDPECRTLRPLLAPDHHASR